LWGIARFDLNLNDDEFWDLCPIEFDALWKRWILQQEREDRRVALIAVTLVNINRSKKSQPVKIDDFMLHKFKKEEDTQQPWEKQLQTVRMIQHLFDKEKERKQRQQSK